MFRLAVTFALAVAVFACANHAAAHLYLPDDGTHTSPEAALHVADPSISQVVYREFPEETVPFWMSFDLKEGDRQFFQLGLPRLDRLSDYAPGLALVGPGLDPAELPFDLPEGTGALVYGREDFERRTFDEPFTGTRDWILLERTVRVPATGRYYLVAWEPGQTGGKCFLAVGTKERYGLRDILDLGNVIRRVRAFHEVDGERMPFLPFLLTVLAGILNLLLGWLVR